MAFDLSVVVMQVAGGGVTQATETALNQLAQSIGAAIPNIIAALILLAVGYVVGRAISWVVAKILDKTKLDTTMNKTGLGQAISRSGWSFARLLTVAVKWFVYIFFIAAAINVLQFQQLSGAINQIWFWLPNLVAFLVVLIVGAIIADFVGGWIRKELEYRRVSGGKILGLSAQVILYAVAMVIAVYQLQIAQPIIQTIVQAVVWSIAAAFAVGVGVGLAYGLKELMPKLIKGSTQVENILKPGQSVRFDGHAGTIQQVGAFNIVLKSESGETVVIPTENVINKEIIIRSGPEPELVEKKVQHVIEIEKEQM